MRIKKKKTRNLNDGYVDVYKVKSNTNEFNADITPKSLEDMEYMMPLAYTEQSKREEDYSFAESTGHALHLKIRTLLADASKDCKIVHDNIIYNILKIDYARAEGVMYLYLEEGKHLVKEDKGSAD